MALVLFTIVITIFLILITLVGINNIFESKHSCSKTSFNIKVYCQLKSFFEELESAQHKDGIHHLRDAEAVPEIVKRHLVVVIVDLIEEVPQDRQRNVELFR